MRAHTGPRRLSWIHSTRLHVVLYSLLLVFTPFILLQNFLVEMIGHVSGTRVTVGGVAVPVVPVIGGVFVLGLLVWFRARVTWRLLLAVVAVVLLIGLAQQITDYYFGHHFYDLQQNWHYIAYGLFAYMVYRDLAPRGWRLPRIMLVTYLAALSFSTFDETFQKYMSSRVFDISDIAKDVWGALLGMVLLYLGGDLSAALLEGWTRLRHRRLRDYLNHPFSLLVLMTVLALLLLCFSSLLTDFEHWPLVVAWTAGTFAVFFALLHASQYRPVRYALLAVVLVAGAAQAYAYFKYRDDGIVAERFGLTVYKGIPIVFFDVLIFPDGSFRPVDKKHYFNKRDQQFFLRHKPDILVVGAGFQGAGGNGFREKTPCHFVYNPHTQRATQIIILRTPDACRVFNRLKREGKNVMFVLHSTC